jgi:hypothetical protein
MEDNVKPGTIPAPMQRIPFGAKPLQSAPIETNAAGRQLRSTASQGVSDAAVKPVVVAEGAGDADRSSGPASTEAVAQTTGDIDTTPLAKRFKK